MIIIRLRSGLGNQMFQYAFFKQMQYWHGKENVKLDIDTYIWNTHNGREIDKVFGIDFSGDTAPSSASFALADVGYSFKQRLLRRIRGRKHKSYLYWKDLQLADYKKLTNDVYIEGFWNEERYFSDIFNFVRKTYTFNGTLTPEQSEFLKQIEATESVGIHVRRGDYAKYPDAFPMCTPDYYKDALQIIKKKHAQVHCFVFSDDLDWCRKELSFMENVNFVENKINTEAYKDMWLMSKCKHNIMANSTFSWWAAWLNANQNKIVVYPKTVFKTYETMPNEWIKI